MMILLIGKYLLGIGLLVLAAELIHRLVTAGRPVNPYYLEKFEIFGFKLLLIGGAILLTGAFITSL